MKKKDEKDEQLINIYLKIHNKGNLTMDDLAYLARYNPTCFRKTCDNLILKMPEAKALVSPPEETSDKEPAIRKPYSTVQPQGHSFEATAGDEIQGERMIRQFIENLKKIESREISPMQSIDISEVKELLGDLYMENLFPQSGPTGYFDAAFPDNNSVINIRV